MGQQVTFNSGSASLEKIVVNSKIDLHRDRRRSEDKQGRGVKWVYGKRGVNGMEGRVKKLNLNPIFAGVELGALSHGCLFWAWACWVFWKTGVRVGEEWNANGECGRNHTSINHSREKKNNNNNATVLSAEATVVSEKNKKKSLKIIFL